MRCGICWLAGHQRLPFEVNLRSPSRARNKKPIVFLGLPLKAVVKRCLREGHKGWCHQPNTSQYKELVGTVFYAHCIGLLWQDRADSLELIKTDAYSVLAEFVMVLLRYKNILFRKPCGITIRILSTDFVFQVCNSVALGTGFSKPPSWHYWHFYIT